MLDILTDINNGTTIHNTLGLSFNTLHFKVCYYCCHCCHHYHCHFHYHHQYHHHHYHRHHYEDNSNGHTMHNMLGLSFNTLPFKVCYYCCHYCRHYHCHLHYHNHRYHHHSHHHHYHHHHQYDDISIGATLHNMLGLSLTTLPSKNLIIAVIVITIIIVVAGNG